MLQMKRKCKVCGHDMEYLSYANRAAETFFIRYKCPECGAEEKEVTLVSMIKDMKKTLDQLASLEIKDGDFPWPEE